MEIFQILIFPLLLGLLGFFEPCSLGINSIFLRYIHKLELSKRLGETLIFTLVRGFILSLVGLSVAFVGKKVFTFQSSYFIILGVFFRVKPGGEE